MDNQSPKSGVNPPPTGNTTGTPLFSAPSTATPPILSTSADSSTTPRASKKLIIAVIAAVIVLIGATIGIFLLLNNNKKNQPSPGASIAQQSPEILASANIYANYLISSEKTASAPAEPPAYSADTAVVKMANLGNTPESNNYFSELNNLFTTASNDYANKYAESSTNLFNDGATYLTYITTYLQTYQDAATILNLYMENDKDPAKVIAMLNNQYESVKENDVLELYATKALELYALELEGIAVYDQAGCINNNTISASCAERAGFDPEKTAQITSLTAELTGSLQSTIVLLISNCDNILNLLTSGGASS